MNCMIVRLSDGVFGKCRTYLNKEKFNANKPNKEIDIRIASIRTVIIQDIHAFSISRKKHADITFATPSEVELQYWIAALSVGLSPSPFLPACPLHPTILTYLCLLGIFRNTSSIH